MMRFGCRYNLCQMLIAYLMCTSLAGPTQRTANETSTKETSSPCNLTNVSSTSNNTSNTTSPTKLQPWKFLSAEDKKKIGIVTMSVSAMSGLLNFLVIVAMVIDPLKKLRKGPWVTILNLATADLISSILFFCLWGDRFFTAIKQKRLLFHPIVDFGWIFGASGSFLWLTMFTVQVFVITKFPLKSRYWFTTKKMVLAGIVIWLCAFLLGLTNIAWLHFPPLVGLKIYIVQIGVLQIALFVQIILNIQVAVEIIRAGRSVAGNVENNKHKNIAKTVIILTLILFLTAFPYFLLKQMEFLARLGYFGENKTATILFGLAYCYTPIATLNFSANPILYSLRLPDYRQTLLVFVGRGKRKTRGSLMRSSTQFSTSNLTIASTARSLRVSTTSM